MSLKAPPPSPEAHASLAVPDRAGDTTTLDRLTDIVHARIVDLMRRGVPFRLACNAAGINSVSGEAWLRAGACSVSGPEASFATEVQRARADYAADLLAGIERAGRADDWRALAWILERTYPEHFEGRSRIEHTGADGGPISTTQIVLYQLPSNGRDITGGSDTGVTGVPGSNRDHSDRLGLPVRQRLPNFSFVSYTQETSTTPPGEE